MDEDRGTPPKQEELKPLTEDEVKKLSYLEALKEAQKRGYTARSPSGDDIRAFLTGKTRKGGIRFRITELSGQTLEEKKELQSEGKQFHKDPAFPAGDYILWVFLKMEGGIPWAFNGHDLTDPEQSTMHTLRRRNNQCPCGTIVDVLHPVTGKETDYYGNLVVEVMCPGVHSKVTRKVGRKVKTFDQYTCMADMTYRIWAYHGVELKKILDRASKEALKSYLADKELGPALRDWLRDEFPNYLYDRKVRVSAEI
jgi:hypothetical protein